MPPAHKIKEKQEQPSIFHLPITCVEKTKSSEARWCARKLKIFTFLGDLEKSKIKDKERNN